MAITFPVHEEDGYLWPFAAEFFRERASSLESTSRSPLTRRNYLVITLSARIAESEPALAQHVNSAPFPKTYLHCKVLTFHSIGYIYQKNCVAG